MLSNLSTALHSVASAVAAGASVSRKISTKRAALSQRIESLVQRVVPARLFSGLAEIANFAEFGTKKIKLKSSNFENFKCLHIYWEI